MNKQLDPQYIDAVRELRNVFPQQVNMSEDHPKNKHWFIASSEDGEPQIEPQPTIEQAWEEYLKAQPVDIEKVKPKTN